MEGEDNTRKNGGREHEGGCERERERKKEIESKEGETK